MTDLESPPRRNPLPRILPYIATFVVVTFVFLAGWGVQRSDIEAIATPFAASEDGEGAWLERDRRIDRLSVRAIADGLVYAVEDHFLYVSDDHGETFERRGVLPKWEPTLAERARDFVARHPLTRRIRQNRGPGNVVVLGSGTILILYDRIYRSDDGGWTFRIVPGPPGGFFTPFTHGTAVDSRDRVYFGDYRTGERPLDIRLYRGTEDGTTWEVCHTFEPGAVFHVHSVSHDPYGGGLLVATGDRDDEAGLFWLDPECTGLDRLGGGSQDWRVIAPMFTPTEIVWGSDDDREGAHIFAYDRDSGDLERRTFLGKPAYYGTRLPDGTFVTSVTYEPESTFTLGNDPRPVSKLWVSRDARDWHILDVFEWERMELPWGLSRAAAQIVPNDGSVPYLFVTPLDTVDGFVTFRYRILEEVGD